VSGGGEEVAALLARTGALLSGHFRLSSGRHSARYVQCARLLEQPREAREVGRRLAAATADLEAESVLSPALGAMLIGYEVAAALGLPFRFVERDGEAMALRRGFTLAPGERVLVVEDVVTTGGSVRETIGVAEAARARVVGVGAIVDRSAARPPFGVPLRALLEVDATSFAPGDCPQCRAREPLTRPGSRPEG